MKTIILTQEKVALVDDWNYEWLNKYNWCLLKDRWGEYAARRISKTELLLMHRIIMKTPVELFVDHLDGNGLNCQEYNMRNCTNSVNLQNRRDRPGYQGVSIHWGARRKNRFGSSIGVNYHRYCLGYYATPAEAAQAYNVAALKYFGPRAKINTICAERDNYYAEEFKRKDLFTLVSEFVKN